MPDITGYPTEHDPDKPIAMSVSWDQLVQSLSTVREVDCHPCPGAACPQKRGKCWSPVRMKKGTSHRLLTNAEAMTVLAFDYDNVSNAELIALYARITQLQLEYVLHSTHSHLHAGPDHNCIRLVVALSRDVTPAEWPDLWRAAYVELGVPYAKRSATALPHGTDPSCKDTVRLYFMPTRPRGAECLVQRGHGRPLDVDVYLARALKLAPLPVVQAPAPAAPTAPAQAAESDDLTLSDLRAKLVTQRRLKAKSEDPGDVERYRIYGALLDGTALAEPTGRSIAINQAASMLAFALPVGTAWEVVVELMRPSVAAMDCAYGLTAAELEVGPVQHWLNIAEKSYERAMGRAFEAARQRDAWKQSEEYTSYGLAEAAPKTTTTAPGFLGVLSELGSTVTAVKASTGDQWMDLLIPTADRKIVSCPHNVYVVLTHCPSIKGTIRLNLVSKDIEVKGGPFAGMSPDVLSTALMNWLHASNMRIKVKRSEVEDQLLLVATENQYDPIRDYLLGLEHDGEKRLDDFFHTHVVARTRSAGGADLSDHLRRVSSKWFISGAARALSPGCQVDTMLVLEGEKEGEGKTEALRRIFGQWYIVARKGLEDKDAQMIPASHWGVELGELSAMNKSQDELLKSYLDTRDDKLRLPYGRRIQPFPRRCVFAGTTNNPHWLTPGKGRRRYWPVYVEEVRLDLISKDRDQLWAEAVVRYKAGERWHLLSEERAAADAEAEARVEESFVESKISEWWYGMQVGRRPELLTLSIVIETALKLEAADAMRSGNLQTQIGVAMKRLGFTKEHPSVGGRRMYVWKPTPEMLGERSTPRHLHVVEDGFEAIASAKAGK